MNQHNNEIKMLNVPYNLFNMYKTTLIKRVIKKKKNEKKNRYNYV